MNEPKNIRHSKTPLSEAICEIRVSEAAESGKRYETAVSSHTHGKEGGEKEW